MLYKLFSDDLGFSIVDLRQENLRTFDFTGLDADTVLMTDSDDKICLGIERGYILYAIRRVDVPYCIFGIYRFMPPEEFAKEFPENKNIQAMLRYAKQIAEERGWL